MQASARACGDSLVPALQTWFQNKRRRDRAKQEKAQQTSTAPILSGAMPAHAALSGSAPASTSGQAPTAILSAAPVAKSTEAVLAQIDSMFASRDEYVVALHHACALVPDYRPDGPPLGFVFDDPPASDALAGGKRKASAPVATAPAKAARGADPQLVMQKKIEEESRRRQRAQEKADGSGAGRAQREAARCAAHSYRCLPRALAVAWCRPLALAAFSRAALRQRSQAALK
jgi:hypothetical protein